MNLNIIVDIEDITIKEFLVKNLNEYLETFEIVTYQNIQSPIIIFKEIQSLQQLKEYKEKKLLHHSVVFIIDNPEYMFAALEQYPLCFIRKSDISHDIKSAFQLIFNIYQNIEQILTLKVSYSYIQLKSSQITYIESFGHYLVIHTLSGQYKVREKLNEVLTKVSQQQFTRIHKSYIINELYVKEKRSNEVVMKSCISLPIGRKYRKV